MSTINGALIMKFDQFSKEDREDVIQNIIVKEIFGSNGDWIGIKSLEVIQSLQPIYIKLLIIEL